MHTVPPRQCTDCHVNNNYNLTSTACVTCHLKDYQGTTNPSHVASNFPQTCDQCHNTSFMAECDLQPRQHRISADRVAHGPAAAVHRLPRQQQLQPEQYDPVLHVPPEGLHGHDQSRARGRWVPDTCELCHDTTVWTDSTFNHNNTRLPPDRLAHGPTAAMLRLPRQQQLHDACPPSALAATRPTTTTPPTRAMPRSRNSSRPPARTATTPPLGPAPPSTIHSTRNSRSITATRAECARPATSTRTTMPSSSARDAMAATTQTISSTTTCQGMSTTASTATSAIRAAKAVDKMAANRLGVQSESC